MGKFAHKGSYKCTSCPMGKTTDTARWGTGGKDGNDCKKGTDITKFKCPAGRYIHLHNAAKKSIYCLSCPKGKFGKTNPKYKYGGVCRSCQSGKFSNLAGLKQCSTCAAGYKSGPGAKACYLPKCKSGQYVYASKGAAPMGVDCPEGKYGGAQATTSCKVCQQGFFQARQAQSSCKKCGASWTSNKMRTGCVKSCAVS